MAKISAPEPTPSQKNWLFLGWPCRLANKIKNASDDELEYASGACENIAFSCGGLVVFGLSVEFFIAFVHPTYDSGIGRWGSVWADFLVAAGVFGEVLFSFRGAKCQGELTRRSNKRLTEAKEQLAPRRLMPEKQKHVVEKLKAFAGRNVSVGARPALGESEVVVRLLYSALSAAGLNVSHDQNPMYLPAYPGGILVGSTSDPASRGLASAIAGAFNEAGLFTTVMPFLALEASVDPSSVSIIVGEKPAAEDVALIKARKAEAAAATNKQGGDNP